MIVKNKFSLFPIQYEEIWQAYKTHEAAFWTTEELDFAQDLADLAKLTEGEKHFIRHVLAFFAQSEGMINENLLTRFYGEIEIAEARCFLALQAFNEVIHAETYALQLETYIPAVEERERLFNAIENVPTVKRKAEWVMKWISSDKPLTMRLIAFGLVEGLFFAGSFCAIYYFRKRSLLAGLAASNDLIARDEGLHFSFSALLFKTLGQGKVTQQEFEEICREAVSIEKEFVTEALPVDLIGMNAELMCQYIEHTADVIAGLFGFNPIFYAKNPFDYMRLLDMEGKTNFFEKRVTEYKRPQDCQLSFDADF
ncbi:ribonucleotide-diphosphate reductase subunit beta [Photobacterium damselae subsp. piscicida]|nr:ribonucleotide-diphosphate reductase subunit beta [Photobacterium damselae subsp. piscicida]MDP2534151.1 ribonucleotide-diphosphate reductase subunit beta [Photobacterium damselae subsp. piscicida]MDP2543311.1 ribonucleotide-diphosphate reductase subunit beta [Photobacterium damselae subsp. piscicida]MDP2558446.1 ribonucleotide-diphosphate reductase subunit beta [Photobacterium damselae subsp. piscicida]MDP2570334.1 ribonucleotide-diphosphate reductase subunit beta [Photobacterium damselae s